ncbi:unnamed protein product [Rotaria magnacalcarata]|uniref:Uncharacterized protein n=1 Tax=Rotaria magnacalcarata TaxID=392030 RepID=A0A816LJM8_9BILA|nr:unnamed protein product [Rotaria magnacalcarata]CAF1930662.1 unnamed protein product [Rotaria magnacalcarata]CAF4057241.1 unnamed protein product [Rotaria magnacalcarata]CAF4385401.1 unnamed protein product [Rotaria magnacalcarata]
MTASAHINTSTLPPNIFELQHNEFYDFVERHCGHIQAKILQLQHISDVSTFIECGDPTEIFKYHGEKLNELKHLACLITNDGTCIVFPGIIASFKTLKKRFLKKHEDDAKKAKQTKQNFDSSTQLTTSNVNQGKSIDDLRNHLNLTIKQWFINHRVEYNLKNDSDLEENTDYTIEFRNTSNGNQSAIIASNYYRHIERCNCSMMLKKINDEDDSDNVDEQSNISTSVADKSVISPTSTPKITQSSTSSSRKRAASITTRVIRRSTKRRKV